MAKLRTIFIIFCVVLLAAGVVLAAGIMNMNAADSAASPISPETPLQPTAQPTAQPSTPSGPGSYPTASPSVQPTSTPSGSGSTDPLVGRWAGTVSLFFGMATADFSMTASPDGTMTISGVADAPVAGIEDQSFSADGTWKHLGGTTYLGTIGGKSLEFTCDGSRIALTVNPYTAGLVDYEILDMDIPITLTRA